jgi:hypothetical protein
MKIAAAILMALLAAGASGVSGGAFAQTSVGGPKKPPVIGGPVKQNSPVLPGNKAGSAVVTPTPTAKTAKAAVPATKPTTPPPPNPPQKTDIKDTKKGT